MVSVKKIERDAIVALVALYRAYAAEGMERLGPEEIAALVGYKQAHRLKDAVLHCMVERGWAYRLGKELGLTPSGRQCAERILKREGY